MGREEGRRNGREGGTGGSRDSGKERRHTTHIRSAKTKAVHSLRPFGMSAILVSVSLNVIVHNSTCIHTVR
jgi:hypothetical protein